MTIDSETIPDAEATPEKQPDIAVATNNADDAFDDLENSLDDEMLAELDAAVAEFEITEKQDVWIDSEENAPAVDVEVRVEPEEEAVTPLTPPAPPAPKSPAAKSGPARTNQPRTRAIKATSKTLSARQARPGTPKKSNNSIFAFAGLILVGIMFIGIIFALDDGEIGIRPPPVRNHATAPRTHKHRPKRKRPSLPTGADNAEAMEELDGLTMAEYMRKHHLDQNQYLLMRKKALADYREMRKREAREAREAKRNGPETSPAAPSEQDTDSNIPIAQPQETPAGDEW